jgi:hypothetical protein
MGGERVPVVAVDQGSDLKLLRRLQHDGRVELVQAHTLEQQFRQVRGQGKAFRLDVSRLGGPDMLAGENFYEVGRLLGPGKDADVEHVYASWLNGNAYFVTENVDDFIHDGRREELEALLPGLRIRRTAELVREQGGA